MFKQLQKFNKNKFKLKFGECESLSHLLNEIRGKALKMSSESEVAYNQCDEVLIDINYG